MQRLYCVHSTISRDLYLPQQQKVQGARPKTDSSAVFLKMVLFSSSFPRIRHFWDLLLNKNTDTLADISRGLHKIWFFFFNQIVFSKLNQMPYKCPTMLHWSNYLFSQICNLIRFFWQDLFSIKPCWLALITSCPFILYQLNPIFYYSLLTSPLVWC